MTKPREFWIAGRSDTKLEAIETPCDDYSGYSRSVYVIEHSAYSELQARLAIATGALEEAAKYYKIDDCNGDAGDICKQALAKIKGIKGGE